MENTIFQLSGLNEFGLILKKENKTEFIKSFIGFIRGLVYTDVFRPLCFPVASASLFCDCSGFSTGIAVENAQITAEAVWRTIVNQVNYSPSNQRGRFLKRLYLDLEKGKRLLKELWKGGFMKVYRNRGKRRNVKKLMQARDQMVDMQDVFAMAISHYNQKGWGNHADFEKEIKAAIA